jgi:drug/metabolite transporter (DMT)-like permease
MSDAERSPRSALAALVVGATLISFSPVFVRIASVGPTTAGFYRTLFGGLTLLAIVFARGERLWAGFRPFLLAGACGLLFAADLSLWHRAINYIGPGLATIAGNFQVFFLAAFGIVVFRERADWKYLLSVPLALAGLFLLVGIGWSGHDPDYKKGVVYGVSTAVAYATFILVLQRSQKVAPRMGATANLCLISLITAAAMGIEAAMQKESFVIPDARSWSALLAYGIVCQVAAWVIISRALAKVDASRAGLILLLQPTLAFVWDVVFFARPTGAADIVGALLAVTAIYLGGSRARK